MADYVVKFTGQDNLSGTIKNIKNELNQTGQTATKLDQIRDKFNRISNSSAPLKKQLRDIQALMAQMNLKGLSGTKEFADAAAKAGQLKDAINDAATATRLLSSDTAGLDAGIKALQGLAGAAGVATGAMGLLGVENEKVQQAMLKVQSVMAIMNGVQQVANALNKDSILMLKLKQIWQKANAASLTTSTVATTANTTATVANTTAIGVSTVAKKAWNVVTAISKALLGDWTGLLLVGAGALLTYSIATSDSTDKQKAHNKELDEGQKRMQDYTEKVGSGAAQLVGKYQLLRSEWNNLKTTGEKTQWIKNNATEFRNLGLKVNDLTSAENAFVGNTNNVVKALEARARVMAAQAMITEAYTSYYKTVLNADASVAGGGYYTPAKVGDTYSSTEARGAGTYDSSRSGYSYLRVQSQQEADQINAYRQQKARETNKKIKDDATASLNKTVNQATKIIADGNKQIQASGLNFSTGGGGGRSTSGGRSTGGGSHTEKKLGKGVDIPIKGLNIKILEPIKLLDVDKSSKLTTENVRNAVIAAYDAAETEANKLKESVSRGIIDKQTAIDEIEEINQALQNLGLKPIEIEFTTDFEDKVVIPYQKFTEKADKVFSALDGIKSVANSVQGLTRDIKEGANAWVIFTDAISVVQSLLEGINAVMTVTTMIQKLMGTTATETAAVDTAATQQEVANSVSQTAAKSSEAIAGATASGASQAFPYNIIAIALGVAAVIAALATSFADGGYIGGNSFHGDKLLARVNAGEMILNQKQQANLFRMLDGGATGSGGQVEFKISGSTLKGVLKNYDNKMSKVR